MNLIAIINQIQTRHIKINRVHLFYSFDYPDTLLWRSPCTRTSSKTITMAMSIAVATRASVCFIKICHCGIQCFANQSFKFSRLLNKLKCKVSDFDLR